MSTAILPTVDQETVSAAVDHALGLGLLMARPDGSLTHAPFTLAPSPFPRRAFREALRLATDFNTLMQRVAADTEFLDDIAGRVGLHDPFTAGLSDIHRTVRAEGLGQTAALGLFRSDYLLHAPTGDSRPVLRQVEINAIASSFGALGTRVAELHRFLLESRGLADLDLPLNTALQDLAAGIASAWRLYGRPHSAVCFLVQAGERNVFDQRLLEYVLWRDHGVRTVRRSLGEIAAGAHLRGPQRRLILTDGDLEIGVVYLRAGYTPDDYPGPAQWEGRLRIERSSAIKCPDIATHLSGMKKVQETLTGPALSRFLPDPAEAERIMACFAEFPDLDDSRTLRRVQASPSSYVLKPQREGGGNNLYDQAMLRTLATLKGDRHQAWVLMQRIHPPRVRNVLVRDGRAREEAEAIAELGIFSVSLTRDGQSLVNRPAGHLLRTKPAGHTEGGVAAGFSVLDSPALVPD